MKWILIGHRGVGKTQLLKRLQTYFQKPDLAFIDLDHEIEKRLQIPLSDLFSGLGEKHFRHLEGKMFLEINDTYPHYILSVGAGFQLKVNDLLLQNVKIIWVRRKTDETGRIFFNRPRLNTDVSPLAEFKERFEERQKSYQDAASEVYWLPEGLDSPHPIEQQIWAWPENISAKGILTLKPWHFKNRAPWWPRFGCDFYEVREDLLPFFSRPWQHIPYQQRLLSFRSPRSAHHNLSYLSETLESDWALELGDCPTSEISIVSCHERQADESIGAFLLRLEKAAAPLQHLKAAPLVTSFMEACELLRWQEQDPFHRSILPRSPDDTKGRWLWLRLFLKGRQKMNFWRDSDGSSWDQPTLFEWLSTPENTKSFAALLGNPVMHSRTMVEQSHFFANQNRPIWPVFLLESEFDAAIGFLMERGLQAAAVTSPFKNQAFQKCELLTMTARTLSSVNTLQICDQDSGKKISGHNTDLIGFQRQVDLAADFLQIPISQLTALIWGGGGTLSSMQMILPDAIAVSVRTRQPRNPSQALPEHVHILIWAAGPEEDFPPPLQFDVIIDLNYREDSNARELALLHEKKYISGDEMFKVQAAEQREYWSGIQSKTS